MGRRLFEFWVRGFDVRFVGPGLCRAGSAVGVLTLDGVCCFATRFRLWGLGIQRFQVTILKRPALGFVGQGDVFREDLRFRFWAAGFGGLGLGGIVPHCVFWGALITDYGLASRDCFFLHTHVMPLWNPGSRQATPLADKPRGSWPLEPEGPSIQ